MQPYLSAMFTTCLQNLKVSIYPLRVYMGFFFSSLIKIMEQISELVCCSIDLNTSAVRIYLSICPVMKWVEMHHTTTSVTQYGTEKLVCLLFLNRPCEARCWVLVFFNVCSWKRGLIQDGSALSYDISLPTFCCD